MRYYTYRLKYGPVFKIKHHMFDIKFHSLKQFRTFERSTLCKLLRWIGLYTNQYNSPIGAELFLSSSRDFDEHYLDNNLRHIATICRLHLFQRAKSFGSKVGRLIGVLITHEDYYYILMDEEGNKWYITCCGKLEFIKE